MIRYLMWEKRKCNMLLKKFNRKLIPKILTKNKLKELLKYKLKIFEELTKEHKDLSVFRLFLNFL